MQRTRQRFPVDKRTRQISTLFISFPFLLESHHLNMVRGGGFSKLLLGEDVGMMETLASSPRMVGKCWMERSGGISENSEGETDEMGFMMQWWKQKGKNSAARRLAQRALQWFGRTKERKTKRYDLLFLLVFGLPFSLATTKSAECIDLDTQW